MKKILLWLFPPFLLVHVTAFANDNDTLQWITNVSQIIENATPIETSQLDWESIWMVDEWQRVEYMPQQGNYEYFHKQHEQIRISKNQIEIEGYSILLNDYTKSLVEIKHQQVDGIYGEKEYLSGKLALIKNELYLHLRIIGSQDYAVDLYAVGVRTNVSALCDQWNILGITEVDGNENFHTFTQNLTTDTVISGLRYSRLEQNGAYLGALREGNNKEIYFIPNGTTHEYLLYAFGANVNDRLTNLWYGGNPERCPNGYSATVKEISKTTPRIFTVEVEYVISDSPGEQIIPWTIYWTEGVGMADGPVGQACPGPDCAGDYGQSVLCAYKNGELVYISDTGEEYGCEYNGEKTSEAIDNIPSELPTAAKLFHDGQILILRDGKVFTITGQTVAEP